MAGKRIKKEDKPILIIFLKLEPFSSKVKKLKTTDSIARG